MKPIRMLCAAILATSGLVAAGVTTEAANAASTKDLQTSYSKVVANEKFWAYGTMATHVVRPVKLQVRTHTDDPWTTKATVNSNSAGSFEFFTSTSKSRYFRYYAPASGGFSKITGYSKRITVVSQKVTSASLVHQNACHFGSSGTGTSNDVTFYAKFYPARPGREVKLLTSTAGTISDYQDSNGEVAIRFNPGNNNGSYSAVGTAQASVSYNLAAKNTATLGYTVTTCFIIL